MPLSRRAFTSALVSTAVLALAGCGTKGSSASASAAATGADASAFPVSIEHRYGTATITAAPQRIVTVGLMEQDALLAVGVAPIATTEWFGEQPGAIFPWAQSALKTTGAATPQVLSFADGIQFEKIAALRPDLIIARYSALTQEDYDKLTKLAPTIAQPKGSTIDWTAEWDEVALTVGRAVGRETQAKEKVEAGRALIAQVVKDHPEFATKTALIATPYNGMWVYGSKDQRTEVLTSLGFTLPTGIDAVTGAAFGANLSTERTDLLDVDALIWLLDVYATDKKKVDGNALYAKLPVHTNGGEIFVSADTDKDFYSSTSFISVLSLPLLLKNLVPQLVAAADGDPATAVPAASVTAASGASASATAS